MGCNPPGASVHGIFQTRILEWVAISFSRDLPDPGIEPGSPELQADSLPSGLIGKPQKWKSVSPVQLFATQARTLECFFTSPADISNPGVEPGSPALQAVFTNWAIRKTPRRLAGVAHPFSSGSSRPRNWTGVSCIAGRVFTNWAMREALLNQYVLLISSLLMVGQGSLSSPVRTMAMYCFWILNRNLLREEKSLLKGQQNVSLSRGEMKLCVYVLLSGVHPYFGINSSPPVLLPPPIELSF